MSKFSISENIPQVISKIERFRQQHKQLPEAQYYSIKRYLQDAPHDEEHKQLREAFTELRLSTDLVFFLNKLWTHMGLPPLTDIQRDIAKFLENCPDRSGIEAFRGVGKSFLTAGFCLYHLRRNPDIKIMVVSANQDRADAFAVFVKDLIKTVPWLMHLKPEAGRRDSMVIFDVGGSKPDQSPSVKSVGIEGQLTGSRADIIIADDVEVPKNSLTQTARDKLWELVKEFDAVLKPLTTSKIIYLGTPQCEMSLYNELAHNRGYTFKIWPVLYPSESEILAYKGLLAEYILEKLGAGAVVGHTTEPKRFDMEDIDKRRLSYGKAGFALQFMLNTALSDAERYPLRCKDAIVASVNIDKAPATITYSDDRSKILNDLPCVGLGTDMWYRPFYVDDVYLPYEYRVMSIDPSGRGKDETGWAVGLGLHGNIFIPAVGGEKDGYSPQTLEKLAIIAKKYKVHEVVVESNFGDGMFTQLFLPILKKHHPCNVEETRSTAQKELRIISTLEPVLMSHRLIFDPSVIRQDLEVEDQKYQLFYQLTRICAERGAIPHDDRLDALEGLVRRLEDGLSRDPQEARDEYMEQQLYDEMMGYMEDLTGQSLRKENEGFFDLTYSEIDNL